ncbi:MAG: PqqD family protein [Xanthomonadales bacterium]|nr:PqqD family protein [Xanthomonadales bacterium]
MDERIVALARGLEQGRLSLNPLADGSGVVVDTGPEHLWTMNATAMAIVEAIAAGAGSVDEIAERLVQRFQVDTERARGDVGRCLDHLYQALAAG